MSAVRTANVLEQTEKDIRNLICTRQPHHLRFTIYATVHQEKKQSDETISSALRRDGVPSTWAAGRGT